MLNDEGVAERLGDLDDGRSEVWARVRNLVEKSQLHALAASALGSRTVETPWSLFESIVARSRDIVLETWVGSELVVLVWDDRPGQNPRFWEGLAAQGIPVRRLSVVLPGFASDVTVYEIPFDGHPNRLAHDRIAAYVVSEFLGDASNP